MFSAQERSMLCLVMGSGWWSPESKEIIPRKTVVLNRPVRLAPFKICTENMYAIVEREREEPMRITIPRHQSGIKVLYTIESKILILMRDVYDLCTTNYKTLLKEINKNLNNGEVYHVHGLLTLNTVKMSILLKLVQCYSYENSSKLSL